MRKEFELLAPAGSLEICKGVIEAGADAVYAGGELFGARAYADNFSQAELLEALDFAHLRGKKIYLTVNTLFKNSEIDRLYDYLLPFYEHGLDAVIVQDMGVLALVHQWFPEMQIHTSTQMTVTGVEGAKLLKELGVFRAVMARELSIREMKAIHEETGMELEAFVHGALCYCYSGQCLFSSMLGGRSGNRGRCAQPCRLPYTVLDQGRREVRKESYVLSLKDLCGINRLPELLDAGVYSLKIEGRMKQLSYAAGVVSFYRKYVDQCLLPEGGFRVTREDQKALTGLGSRCGFTEAYFNRQNGKDMITFEKPSFRQTGDFPQTEKKYLPIEGKLKLYAGRPAELTLSDGKRTIMVTGASPEKAQKQPLTAEDLQKRMKKTKDTAFFFQNLSIDMEEELFLPNGAVNQLRRDGIRALEEAILGGYNRQVPHTKNLVIGKTEARTAGAGNGITETPSGDRVAVSLENRELLNTVLQQGFVYAVYLDSNAYPRETLFSELQKDAALCHMNGKKAYFVFPYIFRRQTSEFYKEHLEELKAAGLDGTVVKTYEELWFAKEYLKDLTIVADHNLYTYNDPAVHIFEALGVSRCTVPLELNRKEISRRNNHGSEMLLYGYYPLMTSAQCVQKNTAGCKHTAGIVYLKDRYNKQFPVKNCCSECYNIVYNSLPTCLFAGLEELKAAGIHNFRLHFTIETKAEVTAVCRLFEEFQAGARTRLPDEWKDRYTNGHYKRGVE